MTSIEEHCRSKEHYDKFVDVVNGKKVKAFEIQAKNDVDAAKQEDDNAGDKRKVDEDGDDEDEDDSGNWKRQKKSEFPICCD